MPKLASDARCSGCGGCQSACPTGALTLAPDAEGFLKPRVREDACTRCGKCTAACPELSPPAPVAGARQTPECCYVYAADEQARLRGASGGAFYALARAFLAAGDAAVVFGAVWRGLDVVFAEARTEEQLRAMQGSKYVQALPETAYRRMRECTRAGERVLLGALPCQVAAARKVVDSELFTGLALACHGVPSRAVFAASAAQSGAPESARFRAKRYGWKRMTLEFFERGRKLPAPAASPIPDAFWRKLPSTACDWSQSYFYVFARNADMGKCCYDCSFVAHPQCFDAMLSDAWGIWRVDSTLDDKRGLSAVVIGGERGRALVEDAVGQGLMMSRPASFEDVTRGVPRLKSGKYDDRFRALRDEFYESFARGESLEAFVARRLAPSPKERAAKLVFAVLDTLYRPKDE